MPAEGARLAARFAKVAASEECLAEVGGLARPCDSRLFPAPDNALAVRKIVDAETDSAKSVVVVMP